MNARQAHRWVAAGLADPALLARWRRDPESLRETGLRPGELDLDALWMFAGLSEKVKHTGCRAHLQLTFRLLNKLGLEIDVFAEYAASAIERRRGRLSVDERTEALAHFLAGWLRPERDAHALVLDLLRHELAIARLRELAAAGGRAAPAPVVRGRLPSRPSVPVIVGELLLHELSFDPRVIAERVRRDPTFSDLRRGVVRLGYWWDGVAREPRLLDLDELAAGLLAMVDGDTSIGTMAARLDCDFERLLAPFAELVVLGLVRFEEPDPCI